MLFQSNFCESYTGLYVFFVEIAKTYIAITLFFP